MWLALLPRLGISYGEILPSLAVFVFLRAGLFILWLILLAGLAIIRSGAIQVNTIWILATLNFLLLGIGLYSFYVEPMQLTVGRIEVPLPGLDHPVRIVQISDIHMERTTRRERALSALVESLHPDLIVITGDYLNKGYKESPESVRDLKELLGQLHAPLGIYSVNGNMDTTSVLNDLLVGLNIRTLANDVVRIPELGDHFVIVGLNTHLSGDEIKLKRLMEQVKPDDFSLLLYHKPDLAYAARDLHINLYLAGHTHGGQVRLPLFGAIFTNSRYGKTFEMGLYHLGQTTLYVSRGLGMVVGKFAPRARFLCPPEVVVVDLMPVGAPGGQ